MCCCCCFCCFFCFLLFFLLLFCCFFFIFVRFWSCVLSESTHDEKRGKKNIKITTIYKPVEQTHYCVFFKIITWKERKVYVLSKNLHQCTLCTQRIMLSIAKTRLYNFDPLKPHFYTVKLAFTGVYIIFVISAQNIHSGYSLEPPRRGGSNENSQSMFWAEI